ncbi:MAG: N-acetylmuramoyl-L-alanine amidase [Moraxellaceae bacterium]|nr:N-acetylmuramoyl-L-alanine amidase [Moraxellaceae bacterium]
MKKFVKSLVFSLGLSIAAVNTWAASITAVRSWRAPDNTRIVLDLSEQVLYRQVNTNNNKQIIIELDNTDTAISTLSLPSRIGLVQNVLLESVGSKQRLIINLSDEVKPKVFMLAANEKLSPRLVIDLYDKVVMQAVSTPVLDDDSSNQSNNDGRPIIVVVDAGHGGEDSGAIGATGNYEKHVTLAIAKKLVAIFRKEEGFKAYLTRDGDYFIPLVERRKIARNRYKADIFISVHADAALSPLAKGASVFALSRKGGNAATSRFAQAMADRENKSDLIGGVDSTSISKDSQLTNILADMVVEGSMAHGLNMGALILKELGGLTKLHSRHVEQAGFAVLKEAGMISVLVETGFITSPDEEKNLTDNDYQQKMAQTIFDGVHSFASSYPIPKSYFAWSKEQRTSKQKKRALAEVGAPPPKVVNAAEKLIDKPIEKPIEKPVAVSFKPDNVALIASFAQNKSPTVVNTKPEVAVVKAEPLPPKTVPTVKATLPTSLDDFMADANAVKKTPPVTPKIEPKAVVKAESKLKVKESLATKYTVTKGDTLSAISARYQLNPEDIKKWNNLSTDNVVLGQALVLKEPVLITKIKTPPPAKLSSHKVKAGDSLSSIAIKYGVSMQALRDANHLKDDNVLLDTTLKIPKP